MEWVAQLYDGGVVSSTDATSPDLRHLAGDAISVAFKWGEHTMVVKVDRSKGESIHRFTRRSIRVSVSAAETRSAWEVFELRASDGRMISRVYWLPDGGPVLSTEDLYP